MAINHFWVVCRATPKEVLESYAIFSPDGKSSVSFTGNIAGATRLTSFEEVPAIFKNKRRFFVSREWEETAE